MALRRSSFLSRPPQTFPAQALLALLLVASSPAWAAESLSPDAAQPAAPAKLSGALAWARLLGNSVTGQTPDGSYTQFFLSDGTIRHLDRDGPDRGKWRLAEPNICFSFPEDDEECRAVEVDGDGQHGAFIDSDGTAYKFDILPGNPRQL